MTSTTLRETGLERDWRLSKAFGQFHVLRRAAYSPVYGCNFQPAFLESVKTKCPDLEFVEPTPLLIEQALKAMVRDEGGGRYEGYYPAETKSIVKVSDDIVFDLLERYEEKIAFGERTEAILENNQLPGPADKITAILSDAIIGQRRNRNESTIAEVERGLVSVHTSRGPLVFLLPGFPFKDQNPFRSDLESSIPDFGEIALLIHLHCLALAINQISRNDVVWVIVSDGSVYEEMFVATSGSACQYISALREWRSRLNLGSSIHFIDLRDLVELHDAEFAAEPPRSFSEVNRRIAEILRSAVNESGVSQSTLAIHVNELARGMLWNRGWNQAVRRYGLDALWRIHCASCDTKLLDREFHQAAREIWSASVETAIQYAAFNLASKHTHLLSRFLPSAIRATSHVKPGQVGIPREAGVAPWNGLAVYERDAATNVRVHSYPLCQIPKVADVRFQLYSGTNSFGFAAREDIGPYI